MSYSAAVVTAWPGCSAAKARPTRKTRGSSPTPPDARRPGRASPADELVVELTRLTSYRADVMADWVRGINRLRDLLTSIFPALEASFDYSTRSALI